MSAQLESKLDFEQLAKEIRGSHQITQLIREIVREEMGEDRQRVRQAGLPRSEMKEAMRRLVELRKRIKLPPDIVEAIIEEHRRECGRGPLVDEPKVDAK